MDEVVVEAALRATREEIVDEAGKVVGYAAQSARFKLQRPYLARGGFLVVVRDEETGEYVAAEFDALPHPRTGVPYPAGHSQPAWRTASLKEAVALVVGELGKGARS